MTATATNVITEPGEYDIPDEVWRVPVGQHHTALIDDSDFELVHRFRWHLLCGHAGKLYAYTSHHGGGWLYMHRLLAGTPAGAETDHRNGDGLDNRRANLRSATPSQNRANMGKPRRPDGSEHTSRFKGVTWDKSRQRWQSKLSALDPATGLSRSRSLGRFDDEAAAARAYDVAALEQWGEFARTNFPARVAG